MRRLAKEIAGEEDTGLFLDDLPHRYFDENQLHAFIISEIKDYARCMERVKQFLPYVDTVHITKIDRAPASDSFFENLDASPDWTLSEQGPWQEEDGVRYCFATYTRVSA